MSDIQPSQGTLNQVASNAEDIAAGSVLPNPNLTTSTIPVPAAGEIPITPSPVVTTTTTTTPAPNPTPTPSGGNKGPSAWEKALPYIAGTAAIAAIYLLTKGKGDVIRGEIPTVLKVPFEGKDTLIGLAVPSLVNQLSVVNPVAAKELAAKVQALSDKPGVLQNDVVFGYDGTLNGKTEYLYTRPNRNGGVKVYADKFDNHKGFKPGTKAAITFGAFKAITYTPHGKVAGNAGATTDKKTKAHIEGVREKYEGALANLFAEYAPLLNHKVDAVADVTVTVPGNTWTFEQWAKAANDANYDTPRNSVEGKQLLANAALDKVALRNSNVAIYFNEARQYAKDYIQNDRTKQILVNGQFKGAFFGAQKPEVGLGTDAKQKADEYIAIREAYITKIQKNYPKLYAFAAKRHNDVESLAFTLHGYLSADFLSKSPTKSEVTAKFIKEATTAERDELEAKLSSLQNQKHSPAATTALRARSNALTVQIKSGNYQPDTAINQRADALFKKNVVPVANDIAKAKDDENVKNDWAGVLKAQSDYWLAFAKHRETKLAGLLHETYDTANAPNRGPLNTAATAFKLTEEGGYSVNLTTTLANATAQQLIAINAVVKAGTADKAAIIAKIKSDEGNKPLLTSELDAIKAANLELKNATAPTINPAATSTTPAGTTAVIVSNELETTANQLATQLNDLKTGAHFSMTLGIIRDGKRTGDAVGIVTKNADNQFTFIEDGKTANEAISITFDDLKGILNNPEYSSDLIKVVNAAPAVTSNVVNQPRVGTTTSSSTTSALPADTAKEQINGKEGPNTAAPTAPAVTKPAAPANAAPTTITTPDKLKNLASGVNGVVSGSAIAITATGTPTIGENLFNKFFSSNDVDLPSGSKITYFDKGNVSSIEKMVNGNFKLIDGSKKETVVTAESLLKTRTDLVQLFNTGKDTLQVNVPSQGPVPLYKLVPMSPSTAPENNQKPVQKDGTTKIKVTADPSIAKTVKIAPKPDNLEAFTQVRFTSALTKPSDLTAGSSGRKVTVDGLNGQKVEVPLSTPVKPLLQDPNLSNSNLAGSFNKLN